MNEPVYFVQISDTHFGLMPDDSRRGQRPLHNARRVVELINALPVRPDFVVHTGDVAENPQSSAYKIAAQTFSDLTVPIYYLTGNHDRAKCIRQFLPMGAKEELAGGEEALFYRFFVRGVEFLALDGRGPDEIDPHGELPQNQLDYVRNLEGQDGPPLVIFQHFPCLSMNAPWYDRNMLLLNGQELHQAYRSIPRLRAVFHGHVHRPMQTIRDGVMYAAGGSIFTQFFAWPNTQKVIFDLEHPPAYQFVHVLPEQTIIHQMTFPRPHIK
jgi:3',5'-cyclic AMP phosphodiesterase CpdA